MTKRVLVRFRKQMAVFRPPFLSLPPNVRFGPYQCGVVEKSLQRRCKLKIDTESSTIDATN